jgi:RecB family exonuclease
VLVPSHAAGELLRQGVERRLSTAGRPAAAVVPDFVTREAWFRRMQASAVPERPLLTRSERLVLLERSAMEVMARRRLHPPFGLRPGLLSTVLDFHDELRRRQRSIRRFARAIFDELRVERGTDRGSEGLIDQTRFLGFTFLAYARAIESSGRLDEHALRTRLLTGGSRLDFDDLLIAVADHPADLAGLWPADFDLAGRLDSIATVTVVMTDEAHDAGFRDRLERELPGVVEERWPDVTRGGRIVVPAGPDSGLVHVARDREEEVRDVARAVRDRAAATDGRLAAPVAVVFHRPLPYLYLAQQVLTDAKVPYQAFDALPLAAEPYAALLDLVLTLGRTGGTREGAIELARTRLLTLVVDETVVSREDASALDTLLVERRATGDASTYVAEVDACARARSVRGIDLDAARRAARGLAQMAAALEPYRTAPTASEQILTLDRFLRAHEALPIDSERDSGDRLRRARGAVLTVLAELTEAFRRHGDERRDPDELAAIIHHAIESRTFMPRRGAGGVHLVDRSAARFGEFADAYLVGLVDTDWSDRPRRNVLYSAGLLNALGWPQDTDQTLAQRAAFLDALSLAQDRTRLSAFQLEGDAVVTLSPLVELARTRPTVVEEPLARVPLFPDELFTTEGVPLGIESDLARWYGDRRARPSLTDRAYGGFVDPRAPATYRVSRVDRYVTCPFKYFAADRLGLTEDRRVLSGLSPLERGTLLHTLFERFYGAWQAAGHGRIETSTLGAALQMFAAVTREALADLPAPDRVLEEMRLLGSLVTRGVAERVFELEIAAGVQVRRRLLEIELVGEFQFPARLGFETRAIAIRGKADRVDVLEDGRLRVVDYKLGRMPDLETSVQVGVYAHCVQQQLEAEDGLPHPVASASYLAFGDDRRLEGRLGGTSDPAPMAVQARALVFSRTVEQIESGAFPPRPRTTAECQWCGYSGVCRKEYRIDEDETTDAV